MSEALVVNGVTYNYPDTQDNNWGPDATNWAVAMTSGTLQKSGGGFTLTSEVDFGATYGLKSIYFKSRATNIASAGQIRLGNTESIKWRNAANSADLSLATTSANWIQWAGVDLVDLSTSQSLSNKTITGSTIAGYLKADGSVPLTSAWSTGAFAVNAQGALTVSGITTLNSSLGVNGNGSRSGLAVSSGNVVTVSNTTDLGAHIVNGTLAVRADQGSSTSLQVQNLVSTSSSEASFQAIVGDSTTSTRYAYFSSRNRDSGNSIWYAGTLGDTNYSIAGGSSGPTAATATKYLTITTSGVATFAGALSASNLSGTNTGDQTTVSGNAGTATALQTARAINGVNFDGSAAITVPAAAGTLTGSTLAAGVTASSLTSVGTLATLTVTAAIVGSVTGNAATATKLAATKNINTVAFDGSADITITAAAGTLTGTTLNSTVVTSSLTSVGTLSTLLISGNMGLMGAANANNALQVGLTNTLSGTSQTAIQSKLTGSSAGTTQVLGFLSSMGTSAAAYTCTLGASFFANDFTVGSGSTLTRQIQYGGTAPTGGTTGNAFLADNSAFSGNFFLNQSTARNNVLAGPICSTRSDVASAATIAALASSGQFVKLTGSTATTIQGIAAGIDGQRLTVVNLSGANMTVANENASATAANRITTMTGADVVTTGNGAAEFIYDTGSSRWFCLYVTA